MLLLGGGDLANGIAAKNVWPHVLAIEAPDSSYVYLFMGPIGGICWG